MEDLTNRRDALKGFALTAAGLAAVGATANVASSAAVAPAGGRLSALAAKLARLPRRRDFTTVPMILNDPIQWDQDAIAALLAYRGAPRQVWDNTDIAGGWLNLMRNALNAQVFSFKHPDFLVVSCTHGSANLALLDQTTWDKYGLARLAGGTLGSNTLLSEKPAPADDGNYESEAGAYSGDNNSLPALMRRGVVFTACHNALWELAAKLFKTGPNPDGLSQEALAAELTNHLIPGAVLTPGAVGTLPELQLAGFAYARS